jgi:hypothetical protein
MRFTRKERQALRNPELAARTRRELADLEHSIDRQRRARGGPDRHAIAALEHRREHLLDQIDYAEVRGRYAKGQ